MTSTRTLAVVAMVLITSSCTAFRAVPRTSDSSPTTDPALSVPDLLDQAEENLAEGNLAAAIDELERLVATNPGAPEAARALFQLAALHWNPASADYDPAAAIDRLRQVVEDYPESPWAPAAAAVLTLARDKAGLQRTLAELQAQIDELKRLDLGPRG